MAEVDFEFDDKKIIAEFQRLRQEVTFGRHAIVESVKIQAAANTGLLTVSLSYPLSSEELESILAVSRK